MLEPATHAADEHPPQWWLDAVKGQERRGELLAAFDLADRGLAQHPDDLALKHRAVLALARMGATEEAARRFTLYGLDTVLDEDISALRARIAKDVALAETGEQRRQDAAIAAALYYAVFEHTGGYYPAVNAATLWLVAGDSRRARDLAREVLEILRRCEDDSYYATVTEAEAHLLLGEETGAGDALERAAGRHGGDFAAVATTRRQLRVICEVSGVDPALLKVLAGPAVVHYCGHRIADDPGAGHFPAHAEAAVASRIAETLGRAPYGYAYGSLASGADILWAEAFLALGSELHVLLPFAREEFIKWSVAPAGPQWIHRFHRCIAAATSVRYATDDAFLGDDVLFSYCSELAMGLALLRARHLDTEARQLAVWDGRPSRGAAGTAIDIATWRRGSHPLTVISPDGEVVSEAADVARPVQACARTAAGPRRVVRAMLFGDLKGFSKLSDEQLPVFNTHVLGRVAEVLRRHDGHVLHRNTWGDAVYVVLTDAVAAAACALDLQDSLHAIDLQSVGLPAHLALRIGGHVGPVFATYDPVINQPVFMGSHVSRTARIEPVTPPGSVYVTEPFAAALVLDPQPDLDCDYVGHMPAAKDYGHLRMYRLRRRRSRPPRQTE